MLLFVLLDSFYREKVIRMAYAGMSGVMSEVVRSEQKMC